MRKILFILLALLLLFSVGCQNSNQENKITLKASYSDHDIEELIKNKETVTITQIITRHINNQEMDQAESMLTKAMNAYDHPRLYLMKATILNIYGHTHELVTLQSEVYLKFDKDYRSFNITDQVMYGSLIAKLKDYEHSNAILEAIIPRIEDDSLLAQNYMIMASNYYYLDEKEKFVDYGLKAIEYKYPNTEELLEIGYAAYDLGQVSKALKVYQYIYELDQDHLLALKGYATTSYESGDYQKSIQLWNEYTEYEPEDVEKLLKMIQLAKDHHDVETVKELEKKLP